MNNKSNSLKLIKNKDSLIKIHNTISIVNKILTHTWQFLNLYCIYLYDNQKLFPVFNVKFILNIFRLFSGQLLIPASNEYNVLKECDELKIFFYNYYYPTLICKNELFNDITTVFFSESKKIIHEIILYIQREFMRRLYSYTKSYLENYFKVKTNSRRYIKLSGYGLIEFNKILKDIISFEEFTSSEEHHDWITNQKLRLFPNIISLKKNDIRYHLKSDPLDFIVSICHITIQLEKMYSKSINSILPLKNSLTREKIAFCPWINNFLHHPLISDKNKAESENLWTQFFDLYILEISLNTDSLFKDSNFIVEINSKKTNFNEFQLYCIKKNQLNFEISKHYDQNFFDTIKVKDIF